MRAAFLIVSIGTCAALAGCTLSRSGSLDAAGGGASSAGGESPTSSGGGAIGEDCQDGADADPCADPKCAGSYECVPPLPSGWDGPYQIVSMAFGASSPAECANGASPEIFYAGPGADATCGECACDDSAVSCSLPTVRYHHEDEDCGGDSGVITPSNDSCQDFTDTCKNCDRERSMQLEAPSLPDGTCTPTGGAPENPPMWELENHLCPLEGPADAGGCQNAGEICIPTGESPSGSAACVAQAGAHPCPIGFPEKHTMYSDGEDTRDCTECTCGDPTCGAGTFTLFDDGGCAGGGDSAPLTITSTCSGDIRNWADDKAASYQSLPGTLQGCPPSGGTPTGEVTVSGETTVCCAAPIAER